MDQDILFAIWRLADELRQDSGVNPDTRQAAEELTTLMKERMGWV